jgi:hypothetical protein
MDPAGCIRTLAMCFPLLSTGIALSQTTADLSSAATPAATGVAYVYVGTTKGVYLYDAASNGSLSLVSGSPFSIAGNAVGSNGKFFVSLGTNYVHSYPVASNGAIQAPVSQINTHSYSGSECGTAYKGTLDHTGQEVYVELPFNNPVGTPCSALQSYKISSTGALTFLGATEFNQTITSWPTLIALTGNGLLGYSFAGVGFCTTSTYAFQRESSGAMMLDTTPTVTNPTAPQGWGFAPQVAAADPTNHLAIAELGIPDYCYFAPPQLASFTVDSSGNMVSTNTTANMPAPQVYPSVLNMSPSGQLLAVGGNAPDGGTEMPGLEIFHFNGANPITSYSGVLTAAPIDAIHWDNNNHVYALSNSTGKLYAYTVTPTSITTVPGSPFTMAATPKCPGGCAHSGMQRAVFERCAHLRSGQRFGAWLASVG